MKMAMTPGPLQRLLLQDEYSYLEELVTIEGTFVEVDEYGTAIRQVELGMSPDHLLMGIRRVLNWKSDPAINSKEDVDLAVDGLEMKCLTPLKSVLIFPTPSAPFTFTLKVSVDDGKSRFFELCSIPHRMPTWQQWLSRMSAGDPNSYLDVSTLDVSTLNVSSSVAESQPLKEEHTGKQKKKRDHRKRFWRIFSH